LKTKAFIEKSVTMKPWKRIVP